MTTDISVCSLPIRALGHKEIDSTKTENVSTTWHFGENRKSKVFAIKRSLISEKI